MKSSKICTWQAVCNTCVPSHPAANMFTAVHKDSKTPVYISCNDQDDAVVVAGKRMSKTWFISFYTPLTSSFPMKLMISTKSSMGNLLVVVYNVTFNHMMNHQGYPPTCFLKQVVEVRGQFAMLLGYYLPLKNSTLTNARLGLTSCCAIFLGELIIPGIRQEGFQ